MELTNTPTNPLSAQVETSPYQMYEIQPRLYLSKFPREIPVNITHVLNMCLEPHPEDPTRTYMQVPIYDFDTITPYIPSIINFLDTALSNKHNIVLVHCAMGMNRSVAAILTYICHQNKINAREALQIVKGIKSDVNPSAIFMRQIDVFFGRVGGGEDPLATFHRRLKARRDAAKLEEGLMGGV